MATRKEIKNELRKMLLECLDECGELLDMQQIRDYLEENYGIGDKAEAFVISIIGGQSK